jgi:hypothetical protein
MSFDKNRGSDAGALDRDGDFDHAPLLMKIVFAGAGAPFVAPQADRSPIPAPKGGHTARNARIGP